MSKEKSLVAQILRYSKKIKTSRTKYAVTCKAMEELGECAQEVLIESGESYKEPGKDGVIGEALDTIAALVDLIYLQNSEITEEELIEQITPKLEKWQKKTSDFMKTKK